MRSDKEELLDTLQSERHLFEQQIAQLAEDKLLSLEIDSGWTVKDIIVHLTAWELELLRWLELARAGKVPDIPGPGEWSQFIEEFNNQTYLDNRDRSLEEVLYEFGEVYRQAILELKALPEDPIDEYWLVWLGGNPPWDLFATYHEHYREHREQIESRVKIED